MKYLNLQMGGGNKFLFYIDSSISSPSKEGITSQFSSRFHIKPYVAQDYKDPIKRAQLMGEIQGIVAVKGYPNEHTLLLDIIRKNNFIVERKEGVIVNNSYFNIDALQLSEQPFTEFTIHKDIYSTLTYKREQQQLEKEEREKQRREQEEREQKKIEQEKKELKYLNNLFEEVVFFIRQIETKSSTELPQQLQNIIKSIEMIKSLKDSQEKKIVLFNIAKDYIENSFFNDSIEKVQRGTAPSLQLTRKIQELSRIIYDQLGLFFDSEVEMVTEDDEDVAFDTQLNMLFEDLIRPPTSLKMSEALKEIMLRRATHVYRQ